MPVSIQGTQIVFNDGTTQGTAATSANTTNVLNATASASAGAVGTYSLLASQSGANANNSTLAGSNLRYAAGSDWDRVTTVPGTWRCMGWNSGGSIVTLWLRIS